MEREAILSTAVSPRFVLGVKVQENVPHAAVLESQKARVAVNSASADCLVVGNHGATVVMKAVKRRKNLHLAAGLLVDWVVVRSPVAVCWDGVHLALAAVLWVQHLQSRSQPVAT